MYSLSFLSFLDHFPRSSFTLLFLGIQDHEGSQNARIRELYLPCEYEDPTKDTKGDIHQKQKQPKNEKNVSV